VNNPTQGVIPTCFKWESSFSKNGSPIKEFGDDMRGGYPIDPPV
jgi:hypothetical protein